MRQFELVERVQAYNPQTDEQLLNKAYVYAMQKHGSQMRASGEVYFAHPLEVAAILTDMHLDESTIAVALLHDTIEDTTATRAEIDELFGEDIAWVRIRYLTCHKNSLPARHLSQDSRVSQHPRRPQKQNRPRGACSSWRSESLRALRTRRPRPCRRRCTSSPPPSSRRGACLRSGRGPSGAGRSRRRGGPRRWRRR